MYKGTEVRSTLIMIKILRALLVLYPFAYDNWARRRLRSLVRLDDIRLLYMALLGLDTLIETNTVKTSEDFHL